VSSGASISSSQPNSLRLFELARLLVRFDHVARFIVKVVARVIAPRSYHFVIAVWRRCVKYWEIIADNLSEAGWSWGCVATIAMRPGERSSLLTRTATTEGVSLCTWMRS
jgi:hypothetical protein